MREQQMKLNSTHLFRTAAQTQQQQLLRGGRGRPVEAGESRPRKQLGPGVVDSTKAKRAGSILKEGAKHIANRRRSGRKVVDESTLRASYAQELKAGAAPRGKAKTVKGSKP